MFVIYTVPQVVTQTLWFMSLSLVSYVAPITHYNSGSWNRLGFVPTYCSQNISTILDCLTNSSYLLYSSYACYNYRDTVNVQCNVETGNYIRVYCCVCCLMYAFL